MQADDPPYLSVGTAVSAKYKGAFCEAKVSKVVRSVKCRVTYKMGLGTAILNDDQIKGALRVGQLIQAEHPNRKELVDATITKIQDYSQYTVVFDDGDITTLRRTALCLKSGRHFNESETLDQLPLTHPEHFGNPVVGGRRGRRSRQLKDDSSDGEVEEENEPDLEAYLLDLKRVVSVELTEKKRSKDNWFPGVVVIPSAQPTVRINMKDEYLIRSFKDGRYYTVPKKEVSEFNRNMVEKAERAENFCLVEAIQKAIRFLDHNELPPHWEKSDLFNSQLMDSESDRITDSSDDEPCEEKDRFVAQLYKFMDDAGTPLNKTPTIANRDIDLHRLFRVVQKLGGYNRVTNQNKWRMVTARLYLPNNQNTFNQVKAVYKKCLSSYETFYRTLGVTMLNHTRPTKKNKGRSLIRDKDRSTPIHSPGPEREEESAADEKKPPSPSAHSMPAAEPLKSKRIEKKRAQMLALAAAEASDTYSSDATDQSEAAKETGRPKRDKTIEAKVGKEKRVGGEKVKALVEKFEEQAKKEEEDKGQLTRSKSQFKQKDPLPVVEKEKEKKSDAKPLKETKLVIVKSVKKSAPSTSSSEDDKKKGKKRMADIDSGSSDSSVCTNINIGDKLKVYYGPTNESKVTYEAKVIEIDKDQTGAVYLVHYTGWNTRYDEWIQPQRIAENLSATTKAKRTKQSAAGAGSIVSNPKSNTPKTVAKRGRVTSASARSSTTEVPRSTTPSSVTSSGSRTKSPGTPATRSTGRLTRQDSFRRTRRISAHTDVSNHTESDSDGSGSEDEMSRTRSGAKSDETEVPIRTYQKKVPKPPMLSKVDKRKDDDETEKEEDLEKATRRTRKIKKSPEKSAEESEDEEEEDESNPPKGRDFDLNQIRSELKGFAKAIKLSPMETMMDKIEKEAVSSSDDSTSPPILEKPEVVEGPLKEEEEEEKKEIPMQKSTSSEDIYEFKEPEPFEFESRPKLGEEKKRLPRIFEDIDKSPSKRNVKMSPEKLETPDSPDRRLFRRLPVEKQDFSEDEDDEEEETIIQSSPPKEEEDPFDKLVESPCFNIVKSLEKPIENREKVVRNLNEETMSLFRELPETVEDYSGDMELSDCESQTEIFTTSPEKMAIEGDIFAESFPKTSPGHIVLDIDFSSSKVDDSKSKDNEIISDDEELIREQIQRVIARSSSTDEDSNDVFMIRPPTTMYQMKKKDCELIPTMATILGTSMLDVPATKEAIKVEETVIEVEKEILSPPVEEKPLPPVEKQQISPALQETDSSLLESIVSQPPIPLEVKLEESAKELSNIKTGTKIADSILQKLNSIKNEMEAKGSLENEEKYEEPKAEKQEESEEQAKEEPQSKYETMNEPQGEPQPQQSAEKPEPLKVPEPVPEIREEQMEEEEEDIPSPPIEEPVKKRSPSPKILEEPEQKKRKKVLSRAFIDESDSDSSDSEQLVIARSDDDSQTNSIDIKLQKDHKESDSSNIHGQTTDDSQSQEERNFNFDRVEEVKTREPTPPFVLKEEGIKEEEAELVKEEESDPHLHSLLLCEEEIPRSPAPPTEAQNGQDVKPMKSVLEMPFASAPGTSNSKSMLLDQKPHQKLSPHLELALQREAQRPEIVARTPPTTPESSISNLSPRGDASGLSPAAGDNESYRSNDVEVEYQSQRRGSSAKVSPYSEEDTQMTTESPTKRLKELAAAASCKRRRKSQRSSDDTMPSSMKKVKKTMNRSRQNSDSDDTSDHSNNESSHVPSYDRSNRSPRPNKYNFFVEFDPSLDSGQRIALLQQKISDLRKTYADVKAELAVVERRRKKIKRREREAMKAAKQEMTCA